MGIESAKQKARRRDGELRFGFCALQLPHCFLFASGKTHPRSPKLICPTGSRIAGAFLQSGDLRALSRPFEAGLPAFDFSRSDTTERQIAPGLRKLGNCCEGAELVKIERFFVEKLGDAREYPFGGGRSTSSSASPPRSCPLRAHDSTSLFGPSSERGTPCASRQSAR